jgi:peptidoglycan/xylan/chitin deacetylase (PgdA/CDA1 family)
VSSSVVAIWAGVSCLLILLWLVYRYSLLVPAPAGLPILIYHKVSPDHEDDLTISPARLDSQLAYIKSQGYTSVSFLDLKAALDRGLPLPAKPVLLTFDDGYLNTYELAYPLLRKHQLKATVFLPVAFIGKSNEWDGGGEPLMSYDQIHELAGTCIEFGLHSYRHENFQSYSPAQAEADVSECVRVLEENHCPFARVFAYPYGRMPLDKSTDRALRDSFRRHGIHFAARIGSRINSLPPKDVYEIKRTIIRGTDSFWEFKTKLRKGRAKLF